MEQKSPVINNKTSTTYSSKTIKENNDSDNKKYQYLKQEKNVAHSTLSNVSNLSKDNVEEKKK